MNNKDVMVGSIKEAWLLYKQDMCPTTYSIACTAGVLAVMNYLMDEQAAHQETKALLKERVAHQEGLEIRLGDAIRDKVDAEYHTRNLQREIDARQTYIDELEEYNSRLIKGNNDLKDLLLNKIQREESK